MVYFFIALIFFIIAEVFGRSKHIGRWWTFFLLLGGLLPGLIALMASPSADNKPTEGKNSHQVWGYILILFGVVNLIALIASGGNFSGGMTAPAFLISGFYLIELSKGKIVNSNPKNYFKINLSNNSKNYDNKYEESDKNLNNNSSIFKDNPKKNLNSVEEIKFLFEKGLLTENEYNQKIKLLEESNLMDKVSRSEEFRILKNLLDNGLINNEEFNEKVLLLKKSFNEEKENLDKHKSLFPFIINDAEYSLEEIEKNFQSGNYLFNSNDSIYVNGELKIVKDIPELLPILKQYFPPE